MRYCTRCTYPQTIAVGNQGRGTQFDEHGVCTGCKVAEEKEKIDWSAREKKLKEILERYRSKDKSNYDCIIPVSGGKDSHFQTYYIKEVCGLNPLLVTFNHLFNTHRGIRNLTNLVTKFGCDHIRFTPNPKAVKKLALLSLKKMGDFCWHCHGGIFTYPIQIAVKFNIPLIIWGEHGHLDLNGMFSLNDHVEMTKKGRQEFGLRGFEPEDMLDKELGITMADLRPYVYPSDEGLERVGVRGIYLGNYIKWDAKKQAELMIKKYGFEPGPQERTYNTYENVECHHCGGAHDYLKFLKFGYGRATDHTSQDIRLGRLTRKEGIDLVKNYDPKRPKDLDLILNYLGITEEEMLKYIEPMRDKNAWKKNSKGEWELIDPLWEHKDEQDIEKVRAKKKEGNTFIQPKESEEENDYVIM